MISRVEQPGQGGLAGAALADHGGDRAPRAAPARCPRRRAHDLRRPRRPGADLVHREVLGQVPASSAGGAGALRAVDDGGRRRSGWASHGRSRGCSAGGAVGRSLPGSRRQAAAALGGRWLRPSCSQQAATRRSRPAPSRSSSRVLGAAAVHGVAGSAGGTRSRRAAAARSGGEPGMPVHPHLARRAAPGRS